MPPPASVPVWPAEGTTEHNKRTPNAYDYTLHVVTRDWEVGNDGCRKRVRKNSAGNEPTVVIQARNQPSDKGGGRFPHDILDLFRV